MVIWTKRVKPAESMEDEPDGVRRTWSHSARVWMGRLRRHRHARQDRGDPHQRPGIRDRRCNAVSRPGDDLLRTLDLQVRRGRAAWRHRRHHRPSDRTCRLWLGHGREQLVHAATRSSHGGWQRGSRRHRRLDHRISGAAAVCRQWHDAGRGGEAGQHAWISRRTAEERGQRVGTQHRPAHEFAQSCGRHPGKPSGRTNTSSTWRTGTIWDSSRTVPATAS